MSRRRCSKPSCNSPAVATLTYVYADSTAVLGPLATYAEPHCYDLCQMHSERLTAPRGWEVVRITPDPDALKPSSDDLEALANAVREAARPRYEPGAPLPTEVPTGSVEVARRGHLRVLATVEEPAEHATASDGHAADTGSRIDEQHPVYRRQEPVVDEDLFLDFDD